MYPDVSFSQESFDGQLKAKDDAHKVALEEMETNKKAEYVLEINKLRWTHGAALNTKTAELAYIRQSYNALSFRLGEDTQRFLREMKVVVGLFQLVDVI
jgi:hypothetical protein